MRITHKLVTGLARERAPEEAETPPDKSGLFPRGDQALLLLWVQEGAAETPARVTAPRRSFKVQAACGLDDVKLASSEGVFAVTQSNGTASLPQPSRRCPRAGRRS